MADKRKLTATTGIKTKRIATRKAKSDVLSGDATTDKINAAKVRTAKKVYASTSSYLPGFTDRMTQYDSGTNTLSGYGDIPLYFVMMNDKNGGVLHWPISLKEKYSFYRFFYNTDAYVGPAIDLNVELPLSKISLKMPNMEDKKKSSYIKKKYEHMCSNLKLFNKLQSILFEYFIHGNVFIYFKYNPDKKEFDEICILPPEDVEVNRYPMSDHSLIEYRPDLIIKAIKNLKARFSDRGMFSNMLNDINNSDISPEDIKIIKSVPKEVAECIYDNETVLMETDPYAGGELGSFVYHLARRKNEYGVLGVSILERILIPMMMKMHLRYTQLSILSRNMTPRSKISAECSPEELENLRDEVDASMMDPDYTVMTNYDWQWDLISSADRLIDLSREYETIDQQIFAALGVTKEILTGEGMYSGSKVSLEVLNQRFLLIREVLQDLLEENVFKPIAEENKFYDVDENGFKTYYYPRMTFSRISIRDNAEIFSNLFQLYQKGSVSVDTILELMNIDPDEATEKLKKDMFTPKDSTYNDMLRNVYDDIGRKIVSRSDIVERMINELTGPDGKKLHLKPDTENNSEDGGGEEKIEKKEPPVIVDTPDDRAVKLFLKNEEIRNTPPPVEPLPPIQAPEPKPLATAFTTDAVEQINDNEAEKFLKTAEPLPEPPAEVKPVEAPFITESVEPVNDNEVALFLKVDTTPEGDPMGDIFTQESVVENVNDNDVSQFLNDELKKSVAKKINNEYASKEMTNDDVIQFFKEKGIKK